MRRYYSILLPLFFLTYSCQSYNVDQKKEPTINIDIPNAALKFAKKVSKEKISIHSYELFISNYPDVQMLFETEELLSFSSISEESSSDKAKPLNYEDCILFIATYKHSKNAENVFQEIKSNSKIPLADVEGMAGIFYEQIQVFERIRKTGGMITQKGKSVFFLVKSCKEPPIGKNWKDYENLFLKTLTEKNEAIEVLNADCGKHELIVQRVKANNREQNSKSGLLFKHGGYRGSRYTDSLGTNYNFRQNPITITNDTTVSIHIQITFKMEYDYPKEYDGGQFKVFPLPKEWARERTSDSLLTAMHKKLPIYINNPVLNKTIEPGEKISLAIGIIYPLPAETWWVVPNELFAHSDGGVPPTCVFPTFDWQMDKNPPPDTEMTLGLKLHLNERCMIIPCGQISYAEQ